MLWFPGIFRIRVSLPFDEVLILVLIQYRFDLK